VDRGRRRAGARPGAPGGDRRPGRAPAFSSWLLAERTDRAFAGLADARTACHRHADPYVWLDAYILDALCALGRRHEHPETRGWVASLTDLASRTGMRELTVRALHALLD
jgi:hypothetical protein